MAATAEKVLDAALALTPSERADLAEKIVASIPVGRLGRASDIARTVLFLVADDADFITGSTISVNGGHHMY